MIESNKQAGKASPKNPDTAGRVIAFVLSLPGLVGGGLLMLSAFSTGFLRLAVSPSIAFVAGLAIFLMSLVFFGLAVSIFRDRDINRIYKLAGILFLFCSHYAVIYGKSNGLSVGHLIISVETPVLGYLALAVVDALFAYWLLFTKLTSRLPRWAVSSDSDTTKNRIQLIVLVIFFFSMLMGAHVTGLFGNQK